MLKFFCWFWIWYQIQYFQQFHKYPNCFIISLHNNCNNNFFSSVDPVKKKVAHLSISRLRDIEQREKKKKKEANSDDQSGYSTQGYRKGRWTGNRNACPNSHVATFQNSRRGEGGDRMHPSAVPKCHIFHSNECKTYICSLRSPWVDGPDKEEILEIFWQITPPLPDIYPLLYLFL